MKLEINPSTKVGDLLEAYPGIEETLIALAPAFAKLKNPILRKTVAKVATLEQAAKIGGVGLKELIVELRQKTGQAGGTVEEPSREAASTEPVPCWFNASRIGMRIDADAMLETGVHPLGLVQETVGKMERGAILRIESGFRPEPLIKMMQEKGLSVWSRETSPGRHTTDICRL